MRARNASLLPPPLSYPAPQCSRDRTMPVTQYNHRKEGSMDTCHNMAEPRKHDAPCVKSDTKGHTVCDSTDRKFPEQADPQRPRAGGRQGPRGGEIRERLLMAAGSPWGEGDENILELDGGVGCVQHGSGMKNE